MPGFHLHRNVGILVISCPSSIWGWPKQSVVRSICCHYSGKHSQSAERKLQKWKTSDCFSIITLFFTRFSKIYVDNKQVKLQCFLVIMLQWRISHCHNGHNMCFVSTELYWCYCRRRTAAWRAPGCGRCSSTARVLEAGEGGAGGSPTSWLTPASTDNTYNTFFLLYFYCEFFLLLLCCLVVNVYHSHIPFSTDYCKM